MNLIQEFPQLEEVKKIAKAKKLKVYLVGGAIRDFVLDKPLKDLDFAVSKNALGLAEQFADKIKGSYILLDKERNCARVAKKIKGELLTFDFADYRSKTFEEDLSLRDFTINTLSVDLLTLSKDDHLGDCIVDHKHAMHDIENRCIKRTSAKALKEDPLRMMRAFSLRANLDFEIEAKTLNQIEKQKGLLQDVSYERIREELFKILDSDRAFEILSSMDDVGLLEIVIPQIHIMFDCKQGGYHHLDVWPHSLEVVRQLDMIFRGLEDEKVIAYVNEIVGGGHTRKAIIKLAGLLHDIGKPDTRRKEGERFTFHSHEHVGKDISTSVAKMLKLSTHERHILEDMVLHHLRPGFMSNFKKPSARMVYRFFRDTYTEAAAVLILSLADQRSTRGPLTSESAQIHHENICTMLLKQYFEVEKEKKPYVPIVNGTDIMKKLKIKGSPLLGEVLQQIQEQHVLGNLKTKKEAYELAMKIVKVK